MISTNAVQPGLAQPYGSPQSRAALRLDDGLFIAVGLSWGSGLIHAQAAFGQAGKYVPFAIALALLLAIPAESSLPAVLTLPEALRSLALFSREVMPALARL